jgi:NTE family protein
MFMARTVLAVLFIFFAGGCAHYPVNPPLGPDGPRADYHLRSLTNAARSDSLVILMSISGGGMRSAALSYGVLKELAETKIFWEGKERRLLDEVDIISAVSGGSFTAAYYGLYGERIFQDFERDILFRKTDAALFWRWVSPLNWPRIWSPYFERSDLAAEYYDRRFFGRQTFADLSRREQAPFIILNAADMGNGARFEFTQNEFDLIRSDLSQVSIGRAVAASAAAPFFLTPVTIRNYASELGASEPAWVAETLADEHAPALRRYRAERIRTYLDFQNRPWIHLLDGGLCDNTAIRGPLDTIQQLSELWPAPAKAGTRKVVNIIINGTETRPPSAASREAGPGFVQVATALSRMQPKRNSFETVELMRSTVGDMERQIARERELNRKNGHAPENDLQFYTIEVNPKALKEGDERHFIQSLPTSFNLGAKVGAELRDAGGQLLRQSEVYRRLLADIAASERDRE